MELNITKVPGQTETAINAVQVKDAIFGCEFKEDLVHQVVTAYLAGARQGTKAQKTRAEVSGGGIKPWKQKGTGRARAGTIRGPIWRKGGVTFAAKPRDFTQKVNKKMYKGAMCSILAELARQERLLVVESFNVATNKTKELLKKLNDIGIYSSQKSFHGVAQIDSSSSNSNEAHTQQASGMHTDVHEHRKHGRNKAVIQNATSVKEALIITDNVDGNLYLAARNLYKIAVSDVAGINPVALVGFAKVIITVPALTQLEEKLA